MQQPQKSLNLKGYINPGDMHVSISLKHQQWSQYFAGEKETQPLFRKTATKYLSLSRLNLMIFFCCAGDVQRPWGTTRAVRFPECSSQQDSTSTCTWRRCQESVAAAALDLLIWCSQTSSLVLFMVPWPCDVPLWRMLLLIFPVQPQLH